MIRRCTIDDLEFVDSILKDESVYPFITSDNSPSVEDYTAKASLSNPAVHFLTTNRYTVFITFPSINTSIFEFHVNMVAPEGRGETAVESTKEALRYIFEEIECLKLVSFIPVLYMNVLNFAVANGQKIEGLLTDAYLKKW